MKTTKQKQVLLRLPVEIHTQVKHLARQEERSMNTTFVRLLRQALHDRNPTLYTQNVKPHHFCISDNQENYS